MDESAVFKIFHGLPRQGPGNNESTEKAFRSLPRLAPDSRILDIGCGVGMQTLHLASICKNCQITATDIYQPYLDDLMRKAAENGVADRISTICASMDDLPFEENSFDVIWSEGAVFVMGFEKGLSYWKHFLKERGFLALTEAAWFTETPSEEALQFWQECYPDIRSVAEYEKTIKAAGYVLIGSFRLPADAWWDDYYIPMEKWLNSIENDYKGNKDAGSVIEFSRKEMEIFRKHSEEYGYAFFIMQKR